MHTAFLHNAKTGRVFGEITGSDLPESHFPQFRKDRADGLCRIAVSLILRVDHIADLDLIFLNPAVIDKTDHFPVPVYAALQMLRVAGLAESDQFSCQFFHTIPGAHFRHHKGARDLRIGQQLDHGVNVLLRVRLQNEPLRFDLRFFPDG